MNRRVYKLDISMCQATIIDKLTVESLSLKEYRHVES